MNHSASSSTNVALSTMFVSLIMKKFGLDMAYYGIIFGCVTHLLSLSVFDQTQYWYEIIYNNIIYVLIIFGLITIMYYCGPLCKQYIRQYLQQEYITITICEDRAIEQFMKYIKYMSRNGYYDNNVDINIGDLHQKAELILQEHSNKVITGLRNESRHTSQSTDRKVMFDDKYLGIKGYYMWKKFQEEQKDTENKTTKRTTLRYVEYNIHKKHDIDPIAIIEKMNEYVEESEKNNITLKYVKVMNVRTSKETYTHNHEVPFYSGVQEPFETMEMKLMVPFFHQEKDRLWSIIKNVHLNPDFYTNRGQVARVSLLLHGPAGTGKSTLAYRIARCLSRHIVSLDLREFEKRKLYEILQTPEIESDYETTYKDVVFLFEEFDISIKELFVREQKTKTKSDNYYSNMLLMYKFHKKIKDDGDNKSSDETDNKESTEYILDDESQKFKLRDLLEIFQGPIPFESMVMIANTNKYDEIKQMCPELFRPGRISPVHFGYINKETLQDISHYFFKRKLCGYIPDVLSIPTSQIIELALESLTFSKDSFEYFSNQMSTLLNQ